jgi:hypothetical protein
MYVSQSQWNSNIELEKYRIQSPRFYFILPENNILDLPENTMTSAVSDGNWVFLKPLSLGRHEISFRGNINSSTTNHASTESFAFPSGWLHLISNMIVYPQLVKF